MPKYVFSSAESRVLFQHEAFKPSEHTPRGEKKDETPVTQLEEKRDETEVNKDEQKIQSDDPREIYWQVRSRGEDWLKEIKSEVNGIDFVKASTKELIQAAKQKSPLAIALLLSCASEKLASNERKQRIPDEQKVAILAEVKSILMQDDVSVEAYGAALMFLMQHGPASGLPDYVKNADDFLQNTIAEDHSLVGQYNAVITKSNQAAKRPDKKGSKRLFWEENPNKSSELFSRYASLAQGYTAAAERGQDVGKQMEKLLVESSFNYVAYLLGKGLLDTKQFQEFELLFCKPENSTRRNALVAALGQNIDSEEREEVTKKGIRELSLKLAQKQINPPLTPVQQEALKISSR